MADARASSSMTQIGGAAFDGDVLLVWFSEQFVFRDFEPLVPVNPVMQRNISCSETLAQMALLQALALRFPFQRFGAVVPSLSDNTAAEAGANRLFTTSKPLCFFLERLSLMACKFHMQLDVSHVPGEQNDVADKLLSRWSFDTPPPFDFPMERRTRFHCQTFGTPGQSPSFSLPMAG